MKHFYVIALTATLLFSSAIVSAQSNRAFKKGYRGSVEMSAGVVNGRIQQDFQLYSNVGKEMQPEEIIRFATIHGYSFGTGLFVGAGLGYNFTLINSAQYASVFVDAKYNFKDAPASPFMESRLGYNMFGETRSDNGGAFFSIIGGVQTGRFSVSVGYEYCPLKQYNRVSNSSFVWSFYSMNMYFLSFAFDF